jgi:tRNA-Thr(GGU) m(6)t(6)A37 methyltransferase TsaA
MLTLQPIAYVHNTRCTPEDDNWGGIVSTITLAESFDETSWQGIETFSHAEVIFFFHQVEDEKIATGARHPRNNPDWPLVGIFAQRGKNRPNRLGLATVRVLNREGCTLFVAGLDAIDGTPVLDIKPVLREFLPQEPVRQPEWATELMQHYW